MFKISKIIILIFITCFLNFNSYALKPKMIFFSESDFGPVWIYEFNNKRCLSFVPQMSVLQTCINLEAPNKLEFEYYKLIMSGLYINNNPQRILVIGLGGGVLPMTFAKILPKAKIDVVEINNIVAEIAEKYFDFKQSDHLTLRIQDCIEFIKDKNNLYDMIILDAFDDDYIADGILTENFMQNLKNALTETGVLIVNTFQKSKYTKLEYDLFNKIFKHKISLLSGGSRVFLLSTTAFPEISLIKERAHELEESFLYLGIDTNKLLTKFSGK